MISHGAADGGDRCVGGLQKSVRHLHAAVGQSAQRSNPVDLAEYAMEVMRRHAGDAGDFFQAELFVVGILNANVGALDAAIEFGAGSRPDAVNGFDLAAGGTVDQHDTFGDGTELVGNALRADRRAGRLY